MGISIVETLTAQAASYALTNLDTVHDELGIPDGDTSNDSWLARAITQVSRAVQRYCNRVLVVEAVLDTIDIQQDPYPQQTPGGVQPLQLSRWPLLSVGTVLQTIALNTTQPLVLGQDYRIDAQTGQLIRLNPFTGVATIWEALPLTVPLVAGYGALAAENYTVAAGYTYTVANASAISIDQGVSYASSGIALAAVAANPAQGQYAVNVATGIYTFAAADAGQALVISYGWSGIPDDIVDAVLRSITARWSARGRDPMLMQIDQPGGVGTQRWWVGPPSGQNGAFPPEIAALLDPYRVPVVA